MSKSKPVVAIIMGSNSDWPIMENSAKILDDFDIPYESKVISAHRTPDLMFEFAENASKNGFKIIIAGAGGAAHLPGMVASKTILPVLGVPIPTKHLEGQDSLLSIVQMPKGIPVATFAIGEAGASNAGLFAASILADSDQEVQNKLNQFRSNQINMVLNMKLGEK
ncbi:MAG: 5-(carboxyamino)imidazole ribonucleotide mutase [Nitrosomonadales bacterium]|jgi:5-(carboxyamino)imidazole ribonucleotide mutase|uniref:N5-carboxyaminoimidazole ribonucleotide mutase n=1 Tax=Methylophilales bacterium HTCC2181 TaxID=383631 RepID=A0P7X1_9PROT|nr:phosphoribosylaminoimidazole carboxylase catalytic subunit (AIR carboxylase) (AIRC), gene: PURE OR BSU06420 [Methylophilales bacterium HTCC2181]MBT6141232.1 5-(carboxyamino)imidazole ribonucleotide mutase [Nitrosomonadales bacterium]MDC0876945.1 5-(carboxyamino)imidazole ribonucleotide mutase [Methylophilaceae bacterium]|tara:strand:- start:1997 stop:2494 length:498 start_codon:yes stop_codon:yes gene_type:complete